MTDKPGNANPEILAVIPARGGSKGLPRKNIRLLNERPLLVYAVEAAFASQYQPLVVVSTEDVEIAHVARGAGARVVDRPFELAQDDTPTLPVVQHAIRVIEGERRDQVEYVVVLQVTTPLRNCEDIDGAVSKLITTQADSVVSVCQAKPHPWKLRRIVDDRLVPYFETGPEGVRRQDMPAVFILNGGIYAATRRVVMERNSLYGSDCRPYVMPFERSINIDDELDLAFAEFMLRRQETKR